MVNMLSSLDLKYLPSILRHSAPGPGAFPFILQLTTISSPGSWAWTGPNYTTSFPYLQPTEEQIVRLRSPPKSCANSYNKSLYVYLLIY